MLALSEGITKLSLEEGKPVKKKEQSIKEILEPIALDSERYREFDYLAKKEVRDKKAKKGFSRQLLKGDETYCGVIGRDYAKCRSTEPFLLHPDGVRSRLFTVSEHCALKGIPTDIVEGVSDSVAHQILGQSVIFPANRAVAKHTALHLAAWAKGSDV